jgi:hypothetical protein
MTDNGAIVLLPALAQRIRTGAPDITLEIGEKELDRIRADYIKLAETARQTLLDKEDKSSGDS